MRGSEGSRGGRRMGGGVERGMVYGVGEEQYVSGRRRR
jgi:hypothetical protein